MRFARPFTVRYIFKQTAEVNFSFQVNYSHLQPYNPLKIIDRGSSLPYSNILLYIQKDATLRRLFYLEIALHVSGSTTTQHQERKQLYLQHLSFVTPLLLSPAIMEELEAV
jgi:hypothetical protein